MYILYANALQQHFLDYSISLYALDTFWSTIHKTNEIRRMN